MDSDIFTIMASYNFSAPINVTTTIFENDEDVCYPEGIAESQVIALKNRTDVIPNKTVDNHLNNYQKLHDNSFMSFNKTISFDINNGDGEKRFPNDGKRNSNKEKPSYNNNENSDGDRSKQIIENCISINSTNYPEQKTKHYEKCSEIIPVIDLSSKEYDAHEYFNIHSHDFLRAASKTILIIIDAQNKYEELKNRNHNMTPKDNIRLRRKYLHTKEVALKRIDTIISEVFLPKEHDEEFKNNFLNGTLSFSKKYNVKCTPRQVETLFHEMLEWKKLRTKYYNLYHRLSDDKECSSHEKNKILKRNLEQPRKPMVFPKTYLNTVLSQNQKFSSTISGMDGINLEPASPNTNVQMLETAAVPAKTTTSNISNVCIFSSNVADGKISINIDPAYLKLHTFTIPNFSQITDSNNIQEKKTTRSQKSKKKSNPKQGEHSVLNSTSNNNSYIDQNVNDQIYQENAQSTNFQNNQTQQKVIQSPNIQSNNTQYSNDLYQNQYLSSNPYLHDNEFETQLPISEYGQNNNNLCPQGDTRSQQIDYSQTVRYNRRNNTETHVNANTRTNRPANRQQNNDIYSNSIQAQTQHYRNAPSFLQAFQSHIGYQPLTQEQQPTTINYYPSPQYPPPSYPPPSYPPPAYPNVASNSYSLPTTNEYFGDSNIQTQHQQNPIEYHRSSKSSDSGYTSPLNFTDSTYPTSNTGTTNYYTVQQNTINQNTSFIPPPSKCRVCSKYTIIVCPGCMTYYCCKACQALDFRNHFKICKNVWEKNRPPPNVDFQRGIHLPTMMH